MQPLAYCGWRLLQALFLTLEVLQQLAHRLSRRLGRSQPLCVQLQKLPVHVGIVIASEDAIDMVGIAVAVCALAEAGVRCVTVCEASGELVRAAPALRSELRFRGVGEVQVLGAGEPPVVSSEVGTGTLCVRLITLGAGRDDLVAAAQRLCERVVSGSLAHSAVDEAIVDAEINANRGFAEPELILQCCPELFLGGLLPWHCRITQYIHLGSLRRVTPGRIRGALVEFGGVQQRHGK